MVASGNPGADQGGFAKASRGRNEGQLAVVVQTLVEPLNQAGAEDRFRPRRGDIQFSG